MKFHRRCLVQVALGVALALLGACATTSRHSGAPNYSSQQLREVGERFLLAGDTAQALRFLVSAEQKDPNDARIQYDLGLAYNTRGITDKSIAHFQKALALKPDYSEVYNAMGAVYADQNRLDEAQQAFEHAIADPFYPTPHYALYNLGRVFEKKGDTMKALAQYQEAVRLQPSYAPAHYRMGRILEKLNRTEEARNAYGRAIHFNPDFAEALFDFGRLSVGIGDRESAISSFERVIKLDPMSNLASQSRKYLERLKIQVAGRPAPHASRRASNTQALEEISSLQAEIERKTGFAPAVGSPQQISAAPPASDITAQVPQGASASPGKWVYVVRISSFRDQQRAATLRDKLVAKGYDAIMKALPNATMGQIYVVQLHPTDDVNLANALAARIEQEEQSKPLIFKLRPGSESTPEEPPPVQTIKAPPGSIIIRPTPDGVTESVIPESPTGTDAASTSEAPTKAKPPKRESKPPVVEQQSLSTGAPEADAPGSTQDKPKADDSASKPASSDAGNAPASGPAGGESPASSAPAEKAGAPAVGAGDASSGAPQDAAGAQTSPPEQPPKAEPAEGSVVQPPATAPGDDVPQSTLRKDDSTGTGAKGSGSSSSAAPPSGNENSSGQTSMPIGGSPGAHPPTEQAPTHTAKPVRKAPPSEPVAIPGSEGLIES